MNYRNEPIPFRLKADPADPNASPQGADLAHVYRSIERFDPAMNVSPAVPSQGLPQRFPVSDPFRVQNLILHADACYEKDPFAFVSWSAPIRWAIRSTFTACRG